MGPKRLRTGKVAGPEACYRPSDSWAQSLLYSCSYVSTVCLHIGLEHPSGTDACPINA